MTSWTTKDGRKINIRKHMGNKHLLNAIAMIEKDAKRHGALSGMDKEGNQHAFLEVHAEVNYLQEMEPLYSTLREEAMRRGILKK